MILSIARSLPFPRMAVKITSRMHRGGGRTSQFSRIEQRDFATDLSGPKPPMESLTPRSNSTVADGVDLQLDFFSSAAAFGSRVSSGRTTSGPQSGTVEVPISSEGTIRGSNQTNHVHVLSGSTPREIEGVGGDGQTPSSSSPRTPPTTTSTAGCG